MADVRLIEAGKYNKLLADVLKESGDFEKPLWVNFVKTGAGKVRPIAVVHRVMLKIARGSAGRHSLSIRIWTHQTTCHARSYTAGGTGEWRGD